jgi:hypothetical protein
VEALAYFRANNGLDVDRPGDLENLGRLQEAGLTNWASFMAMRAGWADRRFEEMASGLWGRCRSLRDHSGLSECARRYGLTERRHRIAIKAGFRGGGFDPEALSAEATSHVERIFDCPVGELAAADAPAAPGP